MLSIPLPIVLNVLVFLGANALSLAEPIEQYLVARDSPYKGGWPSGLSTSTADSCPADSVACSTTTVNPTCCPAGNTCTWGPSQNQEYCCPIGADCNEAVVNFPRHAFENQTCSQIDLAVTSAVTQEKLALLHPPELVEVSANQQTKSYPHHQSLKSFPSQFGNAAPTVGGPGNHNVTTEAAIAGSSIETNPSEGPSSTAISNPVGPTENTVSKWPLAFKIGVGVVIFVGVVLLCVMTSILRCRRRRLRGVIAAVFRGIAKYDEFGNKINVYPLANGSNLGYEAYRNRASPANNVTGNVVHGYQSH